MAGWGFWLTAIGVAAAIGAAIFAWVQANAAVQSLRDARDARDEAKKAEVRAEAARDEANRIAGDARDALQQSASAQAELAEMKRAELAPPDWSSPVAVSQHVHKISNTSKRTITVESFTVKPEGTSDRVQIRGPEDGVYEYGDSFKVVHVPSMGRNPEKLTVTYSLEGDPDGSFRKLHISL